MSYENMLWQYAAIIGICLLILGFVLAWYGYKIWNYLVKLLGSMAGFAVGYYAAWYFGLDPLVSIVVGFVGMFIGGLIFLFIAETAIALILGALIGYGVYKGTGMEIAGVIAGIISIIILSRFVEEFIGVVTAALGGALVAVGAYLMYWHQSYMAYVAPVLGFLLFIVGAFYQQRDISNQKRREMRDGRSQNIIKQRRKDGKDAMKMAEKRRRQMR